MWKCKLDLSLHVRLGKEAEHLSSPPPIGSDRPAVSIGLVLGRHSSTDKTVLGLGLVGSHGLLPLPSEGPLLPKTLASNVFTAGSEQTKREVGLAGEAVRKIRVVDEEKSVPSLADNLSFMPCGEDHPHWSLLQQSALLAQAKVVSSMCPEGVAVVGMYLVSNAPGLGERLKSSMETVHSIFDFIS